MKVLVATRITQGDHDGDYSWTVDGELVTPASPPCSNAECGCLRGFAGLGSSRATTTAMVVDLPHVDDYVLTNAVLDSLTRGGWLNIVGLGGQLEMIDDHVDTIMTVASRYPVGTIVSKDGTTISVRESLAA